MHHASLRNAPADLIDGGWVRPGGLPVVTRNPARPSAIVYEGGSAVGHVAPAIEAARRAFPVWSAWTFERRAAVLRRFQALANERLDAMTAIIRDEIGKVTWDSRAEAQLLSNKVDITLDAGSAAAPFGLTRVAPFEVPLSATRTGRAWFRAHGVMAVVGPFNFPAHLPNGHIVPALAMGNTIVFKPADKAAGVGQALTELFDEALRAEGAPPGVFNMIQGGADVAAALVGAEGLDGVLFTGSWPVGRRIMEANLDRPGRMLALEMGGNNPAVIMPDADLRQAVIECVRSAFITSGQRCTCTRRLIVHETVAARVTAAVCAAASALVIGEPDSAHAVFMGPVISEQSRAAILDAQAKLAKAGGEMLAPCEVPTVPADGWYLTPGVMRVDRFRRSAAGGGIKTCGDDVEIFGPLLRISTASSLDDAIEQANATDFGLAASIFTRDGASQERFRREARAGCVNINCGTAGASSKLPFGGLGHSGNHRPAGAFSLDYCAYPTAGMIESDAGAASVSPGMRMDDAWLA